MDISERKRKLREKYNKIALLYEKLFSTPPRGSDRARGNRSCV